MSLFQEILAALPTAANLAEKVKAVELQRDQFKQERDDYQRRYQESQEAHQKLARLHEEDVQLHWTMELRRGKRTDGRWMAFCPKCHMPLVGQQNPKNGRYLGCCSAVCGWGPAILPKDVQLIIDEFSRTQVA